MQRCNIEQVADDINVASDKRNENLTLNNEGVNIRKSQMSD